MISLVESILSSTDSGKNKVLTDKLLISQGFIACGDGDFKYKISNDVFYLFHQSSGVYHVHCYKAKETVTLEVKTLNDLKYVFDYWKVCSKEGNRNTKESKVAQLKLMNKLKTAYTTNESILSSTNTGKNSFDLKPIHTKETEYQVNANMKDWFTCVSDKNFDVWVNHCVTAAKTCSKDEYLWGKNFSTSMQFNDGYFLLYFFVQAFDGKIVYSYYFSDTKKGSNDSISMRYTQMKKIHKVDSKITNTINNYDSMKTCVQKIKGYICKYIDLIEKQ